MALFRIQAQPEFKVTFTGPVYVFPQGGGLVLEPDSQHQHLNDWLSRFFPHGDYDMEITFRVIPQEVE